jgi:hypothetical protein
MHELTFRRKNSDLSLRSEKRQAHGKLQRRTFGLACSPGAEDNASNADPVDFVNQAENSSTMIWFNDWCTIIPSKVGAHDLQILTARRDHMPFALDAVATTVPGHYTSEDHIARILERFGKMEAAAFLRDKLPETKSIRSGDLGEILVTEYIAERTSYTVPIKRLRWKDHRNMAMRGEDVIAIQRQRGPRPLRFLKTEAKSRASLHAPVVAEARAALDKDNGLPSAHALAFVSERLMETGDRDLADAIDDAQLKTGISVQSVSHLLFTFSGNDPTPQLRSSLENYRGTIPQQSVGLRIPAHADFVRTVYEKVIANGDDG